MDTTPEPQPLPANRGASQMEVIAPSSREELTYAIGYWRWLVCNANPSVATGEAAMFLADFVTGYRSREERLSKACGLTTEQALECIRELTELRFMVRDPNQGDDQTVPAWLCFPVERTSASLEEDHCYPLLGLGGDELTLRRPLATPARRTEETVLYSYYDAEDVLLYIGITNSLPRRQASHEGRSTWMDFAARSTMKHFPTRMSAEIVEVLSIYHERPLFNIEHNDRPDRVRRIVDYLIDRDRRDLLVPLISRG